MWALGVGALRFIFCHAPEAQMRRVTGIGGIFFNAKDPVALSAWYPEGNKVELWQPPERQ